MPDARDGPPNDAPDDRPPPPPGAGEPPPKGSPHRVVIKKYANRRLYNTAASTYVTLDHLAEMVRQGQDFVVYDAKTNDDITRQVLTQIIFEEENRGQNLLPVQFLRQLIQLYGDQMQSFVPSYLEASLDAFARQQERLHEQFGKAGTLPGVGLWEEQVRNNLALFDRAMKMFSPFAYRGGEGEPAAATAPAPARPPAAPGEIDDLKRRMEEMQAQIARLASKG